MLDAKTASQVKNFNTIIMSDLMTQIFGSNMERLDSP